MKATLMPIFLAVLLTALLPGCSSMPESTAAKNSQLGPAYTEEEKAAMSTEEKVEIYNEQQEDRDKLVCRRERPVGSRMITTVCRTQAEIDEERQTAQEALRPDRGYSQGAGN